MKSKKELKNEYKQLKIQGKKNLSITFLDFITFKKELDDDEEIIALTTRPIIRKAYRVCITKKRILIRPTGIVYEKPNYDIDFKEIYKDSINYKNATVITFETEIEKIEVYDNKSSFFEFLKEKTKDNIKK